MSDLQDLIDEAVAIETDEVVTLRARPATSCCRTRRA